MKFLFLWIFFGCSTVVQTLDTTTNYMKDVPFLVNGIPYFGVGVVPQSAAYNISIQYPYGNINILTLETCHRQIKQEGSTSKSSYIYVPSDVEKEDECELDISVYDSKGRDGWALIQFENDKAKLQATLECNGDTVIAKGISLCQSKVGTLQRISFLTPVIMKSDPACKISMINEKEFEYEVQIGFCYFTFQDAVGNYHEHTIYGYETFIIRR